MTRSFRIASREIALHSGGASIDPLVAERAPLQWGGILFAGAAATALAVGGISAEVLAAGTVTLYLTLAALYDARYRLIPDELTGAALLVGGCLAMATDAALLLASAAGAAGVFWMLRLVGWWWAGRPGMGWGDVKLAGALGLLLGDAVLYALLLGLVAGGGMAALWLGLGAQRRSTGMPLAPALAFGWVVWLVSADHVLAAIRWVGTG